jgi:hypothetical protein
MIFGNRGSSKIWTLPRAAVVIAALALEATTLSNFAAGQPTPSAAAEQQLPPTSPQTGNAATARSEIFLGKAELEAAKAEIARISEVVPVSGTEWRLG